MQTSFGWGTNRTILLIFLGLSLCACYWLIKPFLEPIVLAMLVGMLTYPVHLRVVNAVGGRQSTAALLSCFALTLLLLIPTVVLMAAVVKQGISYSLVVKEWATVENIQLLLAKPYVVKAQSWLEAVLPSGALDPDNIREQALNLASGVGRKFAGVSTAMLGSVTRFVINIFLLLFVLFFVLRDYEHLLTFLHRALPLSRSQEDLLFREVRDVSKSALLGSLLTAVTQGIVGGFALWITGFPAVFWGVVMAFTSLIPVVGTALVWVPAAIYLALNGELGWALFLLLWGVIVVGSIDNFLRPLFMQGASMNTVVVFFSLIGGLQVFGLMGLIYGPLVFAIALVLFRLYEQEFADFLDSQDQR